MTWQPVPLKPQDIVTMASVYLRAALAVRGEPYAGGVTVGDGPMPPGPRAIIVRRDGGRMSGVLDYPRVAFLIFADVEDDAADLARLVCALILRWPAVSGGAIVSARISSGPIFVPDETKPQVYLSSELIARATQL